MTARSPKIASSAAVSAVALAQREDRVANWCSTNNVPVAFVLAGGYTHVMTEDELVDLHMETVRAFSFGELTDRRQEAQPTNEVQR